MISLLPSRLGCLAAVASCVFTSPLCAADPAPPPFQLKSGEFPPEGSAHELAGELIAVDHVNRTGTLRPDRTDAQRRGDWDLPLDFVMLPYGSLNYHGALAELRDIPIGTHLHGQFYVGEPLSPPSKTRKLTGDSRFNRALMLEDDFSHSRRLKRTWRVDAVALDAGTLTVTGVVAGKEDPKPALFQILANTRVWKGSGFGSLTDLKPGQSLALNLTVCTLKGPGRCADIWIDEESRKLAVDHQIEVHRQFMREHGLPAIIDEVNNAEGTLTVTLFEAFDHALINDFASKAALAAAAAAPPFVPGPGLVDPIAVTAAVAEDNLRTWDQINDRKAGPLIEITQVPPSPGNSGYRVRFKPALLLEGFRPKRIIRLWPSKWKVDDLPREERMYQ